MSSFEPLYYFEILLPRICDFQVLVAGCGKESLWWFTNSLDSGSQRWVGEFEFRGIEGLMIFEEYCFRGTTHSFAFPHTKVHAQANIRSPYKICDEKKKILRLACTPKQDPACLCTIVHDRAFLRLPVEAAFQKYVCGFLISFSSFRKRY